jgi:hypothetical protein
MQAVEHSLEPPKGFQVLVDEHGGNLTFVVPPERLWRKNNVLLIAGVVWGVLVAGFTALLVVSFFNAPLPNDWQAVVSLMAVFWLLPVLLTVAAVRFARRRARITITSDLFAIEYHGFWRFTASGWPRTEIAGVRVTPTDSTTNNRPDRQLTLTPRDGRPSNFLRGREVAELESLAAQICDRLELPYTPLGGPLGNAKKPATSACTLHQEQDGALTLSVPSAGLWRGSLSLFPIGVAYAIWVPIFTAIVFVAAPAARAVPFFWIAVTCNFLIALFVIEIGVYLGTRRAELAVAGNRLLVVHTSSRGVERHEWQRDELAAIYVGASKASSNGKPLMQLHIVPRGGKKFSCFAGRDEQELAWIATVLRDALDVPMQP